MSLTNLNMGMRTSMMINPAAYQVVNNQMVNNQMVNNPMVANFPNGLAQSQVAANMIRSPATAGTEKLLANQRNDLDTYKNKNQPNTQNSAASKTAPNPSQSGQPGGVANAPNTITTPQNSVVAATVPNAQSQQPIEGTLASPSGTGQNGTTGNDGS
ncbi:13565_t:CDS:2 [Ambispora leptoticha]|uniref:13565_t:CDS:1 n=1 Tax=Ambispora leptoticha TaxID=144679 RepID=A0A9N8YUD9_9GLOM|nr:13565_t:CDS:2 [Ambispora leptoticha]